MNQLLKILLTNDDGFHAAGLQKLYHTLNESSVAAVTIVAPDRERSAVGHGITMYQPLRVEAVVLDDKTHWMADGTPSDCIKLALETLLKDDPPDLIISGINRGPNLGSDILYSGTVSAAIEGSMYGIPSIAASLYDFGKADFTQAAQFITQKLQWLKSLAERAILNINFPKPDSKEPKVRFTKLGRLTYKNVFEERKDPRGRIYYWMGGEPVFLEPAEDTDIYTVQRGQISITPLNIDLTNYNFLQSNFADSLQFKL